MDNSIGVYIHIPFCKSKCYYCDFISYSGREHLAGSYFDALFSEIKYRADTIEKRPVRSIFIGGGTPSLVDPGYITGLLEVCSKFMQVDGDAEISMESNPGTLTYDNLKAYKSAGINRLSIGLQAWQDRLLKDMGRIHSRQQYVENIDAAYRAGFRNINTDLIFGLPGQTMDDWAETLEAINSIYCGEDKGTGLVSPLTHLSCYDLKIEEGTAFGDRLSAGELKPAEDELDRDMYHYTIEMLEKKGFRQYEISNFARPGYECRHNLVYWEAREYAGFGAGAHSYLNSTRFNNAAEIEQYIDGVKSEMQKNPQRDQQKDLQRDQQKDPKRDQQKDLQKDPKKDPQRGQQKDLQKDPKKDPQRGQQKDLQRGQQKDPQRDQQKDMQRGQQKNPQRDQQKDLQRDQQKDPQRGQQKDLQRGQQKDPQRDQQKDMQRGQQKDPQKDMQFIEHTETRFINRQEAMSEFMILGLRLTDGIFEQKFEERFGQRLQSVYGEKLDGLVKKKLLIYEKNTGCYRLSGIGLDFANEAFVEFIQMSNSS